MLIHREQFFSVVQRFGSALLTGAVTAGVLVSVVVGSSGVCHAQQTSTREQSTIIMPESERPKYTADGQLIPFSPEVFREWIWVGEPLTPNDLNDGEANFPEFHDVYINPTAWREWKKTGTFPDGTVLIKELTSVGSKKAPSGNGYFQGEFTGLEHAIKDTKRFPAEAKGWGYFSFGHKYPLKTQAAQNPFASCAACHVANAKDDMVFTQYYPVLTAGKGK